MLHEPGIPALSATLLQGTGNKGMEKRLNRKETSLRQAQDTALRQAQDTALRQAQGTALRPFDRLRAAQAQDIANLFQPFQPSQLFQLLQALDYRD